MAELRAIANGLYALPLGEFVGARNDRARQAQDAGDKELSEQIRRLRKPSAAAWAINALARERSDLLQEMLDLGGELRDAQTDADGSRTRLLDRTRRELTAKAMAEAAQLSKASGGALSAPAAAGVEETLRAAITDPDAGDAVQEGLLVASFSANPFEPVDLTDVLAVPPDGLRKRPARSTRMNKGASAGDRKRRESAEAAVTSARDKATAASEDVTARTEEHEHLRHELASLRERAAQLERDIADTERDVRLAGTAVDKAERASAAARRQLDQAEDKLAGLR